MKDFGMVLFFLVLFNCFIPSAWASPPEPPLWPTSIEDCENFRTEYSHYLRMLHIQIDACLAVADLKKNETTSCCSEYWGAHNPIRSSPAQCSSLHEEWCCAALKQVTLFNQCVAKVKGHETSKEEKNTATDLSDKTKIVDTLTRGLTALGLPALKHPLARGLTISNLAFLNRLSDKNLKSLMRAFKDLDKDKSSYNYLNQELNRIMTMQTVKESKESFYNSINEINEKLATKRKKDRERVETASTPQSEGKRGESQSEKQPVQFQMSCYDCQYLSFKLAHRSNGVECHEDTIKMAISWEKYCINRPDCNQPWYEKAIDYIREIKRKCR